MAGSRPRFQIASRSAGKSACAMAAYRAGQEIEDEAYGKVHDYSRRSGVLHSEVLAPDHAPHWTRDRAALWNAVEASELTKGGDLKVKAQLAREIVVPLPHELGFEQNREMLREWISEQFVSRGMVADYAMHAPDREGDHRNQHAHVMLTVREITSEGFHEKKATPTARSWNQTEMLEQAVDRWAAIQNRELERAGLDVRVDFRSFEARGIDREPEQHEGVAVTSMKRKGQQTRVGEANQERRDRNRERASRHMKALHELASLEEQRAKFEDWKARQIEAQESERTFDMLDLEREQTREALEHEERLQAFYAPALATVQAEHDHLKTKVDGRGFTLSLRRLWRGQKDRDELANLRQTIEGTKARIADARQKVDTAHALAREELAELHRQRDEQYRRKLDEAQKRKEEALRAKAEAAAREAYETRQRQKAEREEAERAEYEQHQKAEQQSRDRQKAREENQDTRRHTEQQDNAANDNGQGWLSRVMANALDNSSASDSEKRQIAEKLDTVRDARQQWRDERRARLMKEAEKSPDRDKPKDRGPDFEP
ncbi:MobQ family relaxase [Allosediminivita pacifica]|uniref:MobA/MobL family protein n=1 Tax=Allosediminivita pacifica TaxID=1267769 RepID=A0A2T6A2R6_9RHOB|nr:MobQ family relaxase [Allosediminivita pacifica]PTX38117.1 MobA/MobL family protein [Allosediminivita pacifica]GGB29468.1 hypothetical protein GCM10011324_43780 [Allosediminivita pacifica]